VRYIPVDVPASLAAELYLVVDTEHESGKPVAIAQTPRPQALDSRPAILAALNAQQDQ